MVRNRSGWTTDASRDDRSAVRNWAALVGIGYDDRPCYPRTRCCSIVLDTGFGKAHPAVPDCTMIDWDDVRYFLAVARGGSVRAAAERLGVNHSTVLRRIAQLEERLGAHIFEKLPSGYRLTVAGEEVLEFADQMEASSHLLETRVFGRDQGVRGLLRVTLAPTLATHLLMPDFTAFARLHPDIEMEILSSGELANLTNREADVAIRVVYDRKTLPLNIHGLKGPELFGGVYISRDRLAAWRAGAPDPIRWIVISIHGIPEWAHEGEVRTTGVRSGPPTLKRRSLQYGKGSGSRHYRASSEMPTPTGEGAGRRPAHVRYALAPHAGRDAQDETRAALHGVRIPQARRVRAVSRGTVLIARLTRGRSPATLAVIRSEAELRSLQATSRSIPRAADGSFRPCRRCGGTSGFGKSGPIDIDSG